jgi:membrane protein
VLQRPYWLKIGPTAIFGLLRTAAEGWWNDRALSMGAALAFYTIFSLAPMLLIVIWVAGVLFGADASRHAVVTQVQTLVGDEGGRTIESMLANASNLGTGILAMVVGIASCLIFATGAFVELQDDLNIIWKAERPHYSGLLNMLRERLASLALIVGIGFLLLVSLMVDAGVSAVSTYVADSGLISAASETANTIVSFVLSALLFALIFKILPYTRVAWRDVWLGALATAAMFLVGKIVIGLYLGHSNVASGFGAAGTLITILLWIYYSSQIVLLGAEITKAYADAHGSRAGVSAPSSSC